VPVGHRHALLCSRCSSPMQPGHCVQVDASEFMFKQALAKRDFDSVLRLIRSGKLCGQAIIAFLRKKGFPEVALHFVEDDKARFEIAIECGNIEIALQTAQRLDDKSIIHRLGLEAFRHGNLEIAEWCFQKTKAYDRLSFLYTINGDNEKLAKMLKIAEMRGNIMSRYHNALYSGSVRARVQILKDAGHTALAYVCAKTHGLELEAAGLAELLGDRLPEVRAEAAVMISPTPILRHGNWPLLAVTASMFEGKLAGERAADGGGPVATAAVLDLGEADLAGGWGDDDLGLPGEEVGGEAAVGGAGDVEDGGWDMEVGALSRARSAACKLAQCVLWQSFWCYQHQQAALPPNCSSWSIACHSWRPVRACPVAADAHLLDGGQL
jgi:coatomer subunit alpha